jgi:hypothetical protein
MYYLCFSSQMGLIFLSMIALSRYLYSQFFDEWIFLIVIDELVITPYTSIYDR